MKIYAAGPFFNKMQLTTIEKMEGVIESFDNVDIFRPRNSKSAANKLNKDIGAGKDPSAATRRQVFIDNVENIDDADLVVALTDDRDVGTIWEMGYAYAKGIPVITFTDQGYGMNLMLAESVLAHCKGAGQLNEALGMFIAGFREGGVDEVKFEATFKRANLSEGSNADKNMDLYKKGE